MLKRMGVNLKKLMDENDMLRIEHQRLVEESMDALKKRLEDTTELIAAHRENKSPRPAAHQESRDQCARSLYASYFFFCPCVFWL